MLDKKQYKFKPGDLIRIKETVILVDEEWSSDLFVVLSTKAYGKQSIIDGFDVWFYDAKYNSVYARHECNCQLVQKVSNA